MKQRLRSGFTTGTCASAAAKAAAVFALTGERLKNVSLCLPNGEETVWEVKNWTDGQGDNFAVQKDAGDDPDATDGMWVCARVQECDSEVFEMYRTRGKGYWMEEFSNLYLTGGEGIGIATLPGLSCPPGHYAINPVPRRMILSAVDSISRRAGFGGLLRIEIFAPQGEVLAKKTFNSRLGIEGGLSVLGTTGIVKPMSEEALVETIRLDIHMKAEANVPVLLMAPGNYGESFLENQLGVPIGEAVLCSNFLAKAIGFAAEDGMSQVLFAGHIGKLSKASAGAENTHSRFGDGRLEEMASLTEEFCGETDGELIEKIRGCNTTEEAVGFLIDAGLAESILRRVAEKVKINLERWSGKRLQAEVIVFSKTHQISAQTDQADILLSKVIKAARRNE